MKGKSAVLALYPNAYAARDIDGYWWIWTPSLRAALSDGRNETKSAALAWKYAAERIRSIGP